MADRLPRKLAAILYADVAGYSRLTGDDEDATHRTLGSHLDLISKTVKSHHGQVKHFAGDAVLAMFDAVVNALSCAAAIQRDLKTHNRDVPDERKVQFRIGVNLGDVIEDRGDIYGDGVNIAARLESLAEPGGICVSESVHTAVGTKLPMDYEDLGAKDVKNIAKPVQVYRATLRKDAELPKPVGVPRKTSSVQWISITAVGLVLVGGGLLAWLKPWAPEFEPVTVDEMTYPLPDKPSIAVLPFDNMSGNPNQEYFADGMTDDLITDLAKIPEVFVIARNSVFTYKDKPVDVRQVAQELGVQYVLEGSVRRVNSQVRVNAQLIDARSGGHVWAERYDGAFDNVFSMQDEIIGKVATAFEIHVSAGEQFKWHEPGTESPEAYDLYLQAFKHELRYTKEEQKIAIPLYLKALEIDPNYARVHARLASIYYEFKQSEWEATLNLSSEEITQKLQFHLQQALKDPTPLAHSILSKMHSNEGRFTQAIDEARQMIALEPSNAIGYWTLSRALNKAGDYEESIGMSKQAARLDPKGAELSWYDYRLGEAQFHTGRYAESVEAYERYTRTYPDDEWGFLMAAAGYAMLGRDEEARTALGVFAKARADAGNSPLTLGQIDDWNYKFPRDRELMREALRNAGVPEN